MALRSLELWAQAMAESREGAATGDARHERRAGGR